MMTLDWLMDKEAELHVKESRRRLSKGTNGDTGTSDLPKGRISKKKLFDTV